MPAAIGIDPQALTVLLQLLAAAAPEEGCALLLGRLCSSRWTVERIWPCLNVWSPRQERDRRFAIDPREQLLAQKWARKRQLRVLGAAHSHPLSPPVPSPTDLSLTMGPSLMLILGRRASGPEPSPAAPHPWRGMGGRELLGANAELRCWWVPETLPAGTAPDAAAPGSSASGGSRLCRLPWRMED